MVSLEKIKFLRKVNISRNWNTGTFHIINPFIYSNINLKYAIVKIL